MKKIFKFSDHHSLCYNMDANDPRFDIVPTGTKVGKHSGSYGSLSYIAKVKGYKDQATVQNLITAKVKDVIQKEGLHTSFDYLQHIYYVRDTPTLEGAFTIKNEVFWCRTKYGYWRFVRLVEMYGRDAILKHRKLFNAISGFDF